MSTKIYVTNSGAATMDWRGIPDDVKQSLDVLGLYKLKVSPHIL